ncbi:hypothetical protein [Ancylomarina longa]|uniref:Sensor of ECF-type sigma factor n=1 Tax=Ancylomarina longa TaxID=2487017 RepID=A0A434AFM6_9BACT|nr:hypothetical protein [Ancylomarina longa]RUT73170.1 hypothetical protein DLK05_14430 [Ancylomarina longa]
MKSILLILSFILVFSTLGFPQEHKQGDSHGQMREKIESQKISFITEQLSLTPKEAQIFWPVYNELEQKKRELRNKNRTLFRTLRDKQDNLTDKELTKLSDQLIELRLEDVNLDKTYHEKFKKILPPKKILELYHSEKQFQSMLLRRIKERGRYQHGR